MLVKVSPTCFVHPSSIPEQTSSNVQMFVRNETKPTHRQKPNHWEPCEWMPPTMQHTWNLKHPCWMVVWRNSHFSLVMIGNHPAETTLPWHSMTKDQWWCSPIFGFPQRFRVKRCPNPSWCGLVIFSMPFEVRMSRQTKADFPPWDPKSLTFSGV